MYDIAVLLAIIYLVSPFILLALVMLNRKRLRELDQEIGYLRERLDREPVVTEKRASVEPAQPEAPLKPAKTPEWIIEPVVTPQPLSTPQPPPRVEVPQSVIEEPVRVAAPSVVEGVPEKKGPSPMEAIPGFLRSIGMMPPQPDEGVRKETVLMQWWLPRIGGFLALLSALFFGVYINQNTSPFFKFIELASVSTGIGLLGLYLERKYTGFGRVLLVTGMIMLYLTSVAGYVLPATKVIESPIAGSIVQALILLGICWVGYVRQSRVIVMLAFHFGYFLSLFMAWEGLREGALIAAIMLFVAGVALSNLQLFRQLVWVIIPGSFLVPLSYPVITTFFRQLLIPANISTQVYINVVLAGMCLLHFFGKLGQPLRRRILLSLGTSLSVLSTGMFFRVHYPSALEWASLVLGCTMLAGALAVWSLRNCRFFVQLLFVKASFLIAVWVILHYAGDLRWMVLALEALVITLATRRSRAVAMELTVWAIAAASLAYYQGTLMPVPTVFSFLWWMAIVYPGVLLVAFSLLLGGFKSASVSMRDFSREWAYALLPFIAIVLWIRITTGTVHRPFDMAAPFLIIAYAGAAISFAPLVSRWMHQLTAGLGLILANLYFWNTPFSVVLLAFILLACTGAAYSLGRLNKRWAEGALNGVYPLTITSFSLFVFQILNDWAGQSSVAFLMAIGVLLLGLLPLARHVGSWSFIPVLVFMLTEEPAVSAGPWGLINLGCGLLWVALPGVLPRVRQNLGWANAGFVWSFISAFAYWMFVMFFGDPNAAWMTGQWVLGILALILLAGAIRFQVPGYFFGGLLLVASLFLRHSHYLMANMLPYSPWRSEALVSSLLIYAFAFIWFAFNPINIRLIAKKNFQVYKNLCSMAIGLTLFICSAVTFQYEGIGWMSWYTPILALTAFVMIILGLFRNDGIMRLLGLLALGAPLIRLFVIDVQDVLHRIIAFAAAAVVLTVLGYLYHRLSARLNSD